MSNVDQTENGDILVGNNITYTKLMQKKMVVTF